MLIYQRVLNDSWSVMFLFLFTTMIPMNLGQSNFPFFRLDPNSIFWWLRCGFTTSCGCPLQVCDPCAGEPRRCCHFGLDAGDTCGVVRFGVSGLGLWWVYWGMVVSDKVEIWTELTHGKGFKDKLHAKRQNVYRRKYYTGTITVYGRCPWKDRLLGLFIWYTIPVGVFKKESVSNVESSAKPPPPVLDLLVWHKAAHTKACQQLKALMPMMLSIRYSYREHWKTLLTLATWAVSACEPCLL